MVKMDDAQVNQVLQKLVELSPDPAWIMQDGSIVMGNFASATALGRAGPHELQQGRVADFSPPVQPDGQASATKGVLMRTAARSLGAHRFEWSFARPDGRVIDAEVTLTPIKTGAGTIEYCIWRDVSVLRKAQLALRNREQQLLTLSMMSSDWFWEQDAQYRFVTFSGAFAADFTPPKDHLGKARWDFNIHLTPQQWAAHRADLDAHRPFRNFEYSISDDKGETRWYSINGDPLYDESGQFTGYHGTGRDITSIKRAEAELQVAASAFESQDGLVITDAGGLILRVNRAYQCMTGFSADELVGRPACFLQAQHDGALPDQLHRSLAKTGAWRGEFDDGHKDGHLFPASVSVSVVKDADGAVTHYVGSHRDITERKLAEKKIKELAFYDQLTHLPNRTLLLDRMAQTLAASRRDGTFGAVLFIDLDYFKTLNDTRGHEVGDLLLKQVAQRLLSCVRAGDTVARLGGDEFVVMLTPLGTRQPEALGSAESVALKLLTALGDVFTLGDITHQSTSSIGVTLFQGDQTPIDELMRQADLAMYKSKAAGRNAVRFFDPAMEAAVMERASLEEDLRLAMDRNQFLLHYQPQVGANGRLTGAEALLRFQHPQRGMVSPAQFIPLAEATGLILPLGQWVLETACRQLAIWSREPNREHLVIAVNVSAHQIRQHDFVDQVLQTLQRTGARAQRLKLELTESLMVSNLTDTIDKMQQLQAAGVGFSLDDFGTGYSSLSYLRHMPLNQIKIDQAFVRGVQDDPQVAAIARTIITLGQSLGLNVIAEGVETTAERDFLSVAGCPAYQGYLFSRPLPIDEFERFSSQD